MTSNVPTLNFTPAGHWPGGIPVEAPPGGRGIVLIVQWDDLVGGPYNTNQRAGQRIMAVLTYHPERRTYMAVTIEYQIRLGPVVGTDGYKWIQQPSRHQVPTEIFGAPQLFPDEPGQHQETGFDDRTCEELQRTAIRWLAPRSANWSSEPIRKWWLPYMPGAQLFDPNNRGHWDQLNRQADIQLAQPCGNRSPAGQLAVVRGAVPHKENRPGLQHHFQAPAAVAVESHPALRTDGEYSLHLICQKGRCGAQLSGETVIPVTHATVDTAHMLYDILTAGGHTLKDLWYDQHQTGQLITETEITLRQILATANRNSSTQTSSTRTSLVRT